MAQQITYDKAYDTVAPGDFPAMLEVPRYGRRTDAFDSIISATTTISGIPWTRTISTSTSRSTSPRRR